MRTAGARGSWHRRGLASTLVRMSTRLIDPSRYIRQTAFVPFGSEGQRALQGAKALLVGVGGLGTWAADLLVRSGIGTLRLVDSDRIELANLHRQGLFTEGMALMRMPKASMAADRLEAHNSNVTLEPLDVRATRENIEQLAAGMHCLLDGTDNFPTRFLLNDVAVKHNIPWVFAGVVRAEGQILAILPGRTPCLRCLYDSPPESSDTAATAGVLPPAVATIASLLCMEAFKILCGRLDAVSPHLLKLDLWGNTIQRLDVSAARRPDCPCCGQRRFEYLQGSPQ